MFNLTVINLKDIKKYAIKLIGISLIVFVVTQTIPLLQQLEKKINLIDSDLLVCLDTTCGTVKQTNKSNNIEKKAFKDDFFEDILKTEIGSIDDYFESEEFYNEGTPEEVEINADNPKENKEAQTTNSQLELARNKLTNANYNPGSARIKV